MANLEPAIITATIAVMVFVVTQVLIDFRAWRDLKVKKTEELFSLLNEFIILLFDFQVDYREKSSDFESYRKNLLSFGRLSFQIVLFLRVYFRDDSDFLSSLQSATLSSVSAMKFPLSAEDTEVFLQETRRCRKLACKMMEAFVSRASSGKSYGFSAYLNSWHDIHYSSIG